MTSGSKKDKDRKSKEESLDELRRQFDEAESKDDKEQLKRLRVIFECLGEQPRASEFSSTLKKRTKRRS